jgi:hypothetical protein
MVSRNPSFKEGPDEGFLLKSVNIQLPTAERSFKPGSLPDQVELPGLGGRNGLEWMYRDMTGVSLVMDNIAGSFLRPE